MRVRVSKLAYLDNVIRYPGEVFEWSYSGDKIPEYIEVIGKPEAEISIEADTEANIEAVSEAETEQKTKTTRKR